MASSRPMWAPKFKEVDPDEYLEPEEGDYGEDDSFDEFLQGDEDESELELDYEEEPYDEDVDYESDFAEDGGYDYDEEEDEPDYGP